MKQQFLKLSKLAKNAVFFMVQIANGWAMAYTKSGNLVQFWTGGREAVPVAVMPEDVPLIADGFLADETSILTDAGTLPNSKGHETKPVEVDLLNFQYTLPVDFLKTAKNFMSNDPLRINLSGVGIKDSHIWATDAHVMTYEPIDIQGEHHINRNAVIDILALSPLTVSMAYKTFIDREGKAKEKQVFRIETKEGFYYMEASENEAKTPDYFCVIPIDSPVEVSINRKNLDEAIDKVAPACNKYTGAVNFLVGRTSLELTAQDIDRGTEAKAIIEVEANDGINISFCYKKLQLITKGMKAAFSIYMSTPSRAALIEEQGSRRKYLVMPILNSY